MKTGICRNIGRQPASGLKPSSCCSFIISRCISARSFLYFSRSFWIFGCISCMCRW